MRVFLLALVLVLLLLAAIVWRRCTGSGVSARVAFFEVAFCEEFLLYDGFQHNDS